MADNLDQRMVTGVLLVDGTLPLCCYHGRGVPDKLAGQPDRIYACTACDAHGRTLRDADEHMAAWFDEPDISVVPTKISEVEGSARWLVTYAGVAPAPVHVSFSLRSRARYHTVNGPNTITLEERAADFKGKVLFGKTFARFRAERADDTGETLTTRAAGICKLPGRQFMQRSIARGTPLRKWFDSLFGSS